MDITKIQSKLDDLFSQYQIIFWNDVEGKFEDDLEQLELGEAKIIRPDKIGQLKTKVTLEKEEPETKFLVYSREPEPDYEDDWLLDIRLYSRQFYADRASMLIDELGLQNHHLRDFLNRREKFFKNKERKSRLKKLLEPDDNEQQLERKMIAAIVKSNNSDFSDIIRALFNHLSECNDELDALPEEWGQLKKNELEEAFWQLAEDHFGYRQNSPTLRNLLTSLLVTELAYGISDSLPQSLKHFVLPPQQYSNVSVCLAQWRDSSSKGQSYDKLSYLVGQEFDVEKLLTNASADNLMETDTFPQIEKIIIRELRDRVIDTADAINADEIRQSVRTRQDLHWAYNRLPSNEYVSRDALYQAYEAIKTAAEFFELKNKYTDDFDFSTADQIYNAYTNELYRFDQLYRKFWESCDTAESEGWGVLKDLQDSLEPVYKNWFLQPLATKWSQRVSLDNWAIESVENQYDFYQKFVNKGATKRASKSKATVYVIVSDAFRYEAAQELTQTLNTKNRFSAKLHSMLGVLPSYTALGMSALLPHQNLSLTDKGQVLCDGEPTGSLQHRDKILKRVNGVAIKAEQLLAMKQRQGREFVKDKEVVYIYYNSIDATGDNAASENQTFRAVREAINKTVDIVKYIINNLGGNRIFITADHGFVFTKTSPQEPLKTEHQFQPESVIKKHKRFHILNRPIESDKTVLTSTLSSTAGIDADNNVQFVLPQGINLFNFSGGAQFVHGGMSLQETVIPAVSATQIKQKVKTRPVSIQVLGTSHRITTNRHRFELLQTEAVSDDLRPITVKIAVFDEQKPVTNIETVTFDSSSNKINDRKKSVTLLLQNAKFDKNKTYRLVLREVEKDKEIYSVGVIIDRAFADDFN